MNFFVFVSMLHQVPAEGSVSLPLSGHIVDSLGCVQAGGRLAEIDAVVANVVPVGVFGLAGAKDVGNLVQGHEGAIVGFLFQGPQFDPVASIKFQNLCTLGRHGHRPDRCL